MVKMNPKQLISRHNPRTALQYTAVRKMAEANMLPRSYDSEAKAVEGDSKKLLSIMRHLSRNSDIYNSLTTYIKTLVLGAQGAECLWRDSRKEEIETKWRQWLDIADASCRGSFLQLELWVLDELITAGGVLLVLNDNMTISLVEQERLLKIETDKQGTPKYYIVKNEDEDIRIRADQCLYVALWKRYSCNFGVPLFSPCCDSINILSSIVRSTGLSFHKQSKLPLAITTPNGTDGVQGRNNQPAIETDDDGNPIPVNVEPIPPEVYELGEATAFIAPTGSTISGINQTVPSSTFGESILTMVRIIASSAGLSADAILGSYENYSYSSARAAYQQTQGTIKRIQSQLIYAFYRPLVKWLLSCWGYSDIDFDIILPCVPVLDDKADAEAREKRLNMGLSTYEDELLGMNRSRTEHLQQLKRETIDAIRLAREIETETGILPNWKHYCGLNQGLTEASVMAGQNNNE